MLKAKLLQYLPKLTWRNVVADLVDVWHTEAGHLDARALATALATAAHCETASRQELSVELVWTGPNPEGVPLRRTDQALLQLIRESEQELVLISFAVYKIPKVAHELAAAIRRGVKLTIIAETPEASEGKVSFGLLAALGFTIAQNAQIFIWPRHLRPTDESGRYGSLHIKCAIADGKHLFITSANLTEYALTLNMEMGLLVHSKQLASQVAVHIERLINEQILVLLTNNSPLHG